MKMRCVWNEKMIMTAEVDGHRVPMDTRPPVGTDTAMTPKQLVLAGLCGCTGMDVIALLKKHKQPMETFEVTADATMSEGGHPVVFKEVHLLFKLTGQLDPTIILDSVRASQNKYCGVSAMLAKAAPLFYKVELNGIEIGTGQAFAS
jgi:putative redox protein